MSGDTDEDRAARWRANQARIVAWRREQADRLRGDPAAAQAVVDDWQAVLDAIDERNQGPDEVPSW